MVLNIPETLVSTSRVAFLPPISVFTHPGCIDATRILSFFKSTLIDFDAAFNAACNKITKNRSVGLEKNAAEQRGSSGALIILSGTM